MKWKLFLFAVAWAAFVPPAFTAAQSPFSLPEDSTPAPAQDASFQSPFSLPEDSELTERTLPIPAPATQPLGGMSSQISRLLTDGVQHAKSGRLPEAEAAFREALKISPDNPKAWNNLGLTLRRLNKTDDAVAAYHQAVRIDPNFALAYKNVGVLLEELKEYRKAAKAYRKYASLAPSAPDAEQLIDHAARLESQSLS